MWTAATQPTGLADSENVRASASSARTRCKARIIAAGHAATPAGTSCTTLASLVLLLLVLGSATRASADSAATNFCGTDYTDAYSCEGTQCPGGVDRECKAGQTCYAVETCAQTTPAAPGSECSFCGTDYDDAATLQHRQCPFNKDADCQDSRLKCYAIEDNCTPATARAAVAAATPAAPAPSAPSNGSTSARNSSASTSSTSSADAPSLSLGADSPAAAAPAPVAGSVPTTNLCGVKGASTDDTYKSAVNSCNKCPGGVDSQCACDETCIAVETFRVVCRAGLQGPEDRILTACTPVQPHADTPAPAKAEPPQQARAAGSERNVGSSPPRQGRRRRQARSAGPAEGGTSSGVIAGAVVGAVCGAITLAVLILLLARRRQKQLRTKRSQRSATVAGSALGTAPSNTVVNSSLGSLPHTPGNVPAILAASSKPNTARAAPSEPSQTPSMAPAASGLAPLGAAGEQSSFNASGSSPAAGGSFQDRHAAASSMHARTGTPDGGPSFESSEEARTLAQRIVKAGSAPGSSSTQSASCTWFTHRLPATLQEPDERERIETAFLNMAEAQPPVALAGRYIILPEPPQCGGQAVVVFARDHSGTCPYAIKAFLKPADYETELEQYRNPTLQALLPRMLYANDNANGALVSRSGYKLPPFIVLERGITLTDWRSKPRRPFETWTMVEALARLLDILHSSDLVHRDLKPDNALYLLRSTVWHLLDMGIVAKAGSVCWPQCSLPYAPPEVVCAAVQDRSITVHTSHDIWALGVLAYEAITGKQVITSQQQAVDCAFGRQPYAWEMPSPTLPREWRSSRLAPFVMPCLSRNALQRPQATAVVAALSKLGETAA